MRCFIIVFRVLKHNLKREHCLAQNYVEQLCLMRHVLKYTLNNIIVNKWTVPRNWQSPKRRRASPCASDAGVRKLAGWLPAVPITTTQHTDCCVCVDLGTWLRGSSRLATSGTHRRQKNTKGLSRARCSSSVPGEGPFTFLQVLHFTLLTALPELLPCTTEELWKTPRGSRGHAAVAVCLARAPLLFSKSYILVPRPYVNVFTHFTALPELLPCTT